MKMDAVFRALADESRRALLDRLFRKNGQSLGELSEGLQMSRQAVSKHLALLEAANLVSTRKSGRTKLHFLNPVPINDIAARWVAKFERAHLDALSELKQRLEGGSAAQHDEKDSPPTYVGKVEMIERQRKHFGWGERKQRPPPGSLHSPTSPRRGR